MKSERMWDRLANNWDKPGVSLGQNDIRILEKIKKYLDANAIVLDYGCATGSIAIEISGTVKEVQGIDISTKMIDIARRKAEERKIANAKFTHAAIFDERLEPESFDAILALNIMHLVEDTPQVLSRINRLLKPGGFFISATPCLAERSLVSTLVKAPVFLLSKIGILPTVEFLYTSTLTEAMTNEHFAIIEKENSSTGTITECFIVAGKNK